MFSTGYFLTIFALLCLLALSFFLLQTNEGRVTINSDEFASKLRGFVVPDIVAGGVTYTVNDGIVEQGGNTISTSQVSLILRTAYFSIANRLDPILALEGTNPKSLAHIFLWYTQKSTRLWIKYSIEPLNR